MEPPQRILVQTKTHLVPGNGYHERQLFMMNLMCQLHWKRNYHPRQDRWYVRGARFAYKNRRCFFLIDHGHSSADDEVVVSWYKWNGDSLLVVFPINHDVPLIQLT